MTERRTYSDRYPRGRVSPFAGDRMRGDYNPFDPRNYDAGGFGFGGTSGSAGGYGVGGMGPQGGWASQANYGQGYPAGDYDPDAIDDYFPDEEPDMHWTDAFPHSFHGWGPLTPEYGQDPARELGYTRHTDQAPPQDYGLDHNRNYAEELEREDRDRNRSNRFRTRLKYDDRYLTWRAEQIEKLDADYSAWRDERRAQFDADFTAWRASRPKDQDH